MTGFAASPDVEGAPPQAFASIMDFAGWVLGRFGLARP
jgi:hypothetical protein